MKNFTQLVIAILCGVLSMHTSVKAQSILDPSDPIVNYDSLNPPTQPAWGTIGKWVRRPILTWNTESYKAYIYKGLQFRLKFPKSYNPNANDGKKYPILMFWHGLLEAGDIHDNEYSMFLGAELFRNNVDNGNFDGFVIFMQAPIAGGSFFAPGHFQYMTEILDYMTVNNKLDPFHIISNGLSSGGMASWDVFLRHTNYVSTVVAMSAPGNWSGSEIVEKSKFTPIWYAHGGEDHNPAPSTGDENYNAMMAAGANFKRIKYPGAYHDTWGATWWDPEFWPYLKRAYSSNPWALHNKTLFAPGDPVNATIGLAPGYDQYEWRRNGVLIPAASGNSIQATQLGLYDARVRRGSVWSEWSKIPVELKEGVVTPPPPPPPSGAATRIEAESFTTMSGIQSEPTSDVGGGLNIGWQDNGDWLNYSVSINTAGSYTLSFRVASYFSGAQFQLRKEDGTVLTTVTVPNTGGFQNWQTVTAVATLPAGLQTLRIITTAANGGWNFNWWEIPDALNGGTPTNQAPTANAGSAQTITLPTNSVTLTGSGTDPDGTIASYAWTKVSGPDGGTITSPAQASTTVTGLTQGSYTFRLTVTDNGGATGTADVLITVNAVATNQAPTANAGSAQTITLPTNSVTLTGSGTDPDGTIASYAWTKVSGPAGGTITSPAQASTTVTGLTQGSYTFRLTVTDNGGATGTADVVITVNAVATNQAPTANAGSAQTITLPTNSVTLTGSGTDPDGTIASYAWTKVSGPAGGTITSPAQASTTVTGLVEGSYTFRLTVTDNGGATGTADVVVTVNPEPVTFSLKIEAENYTTMSGVQTETTLDEGGGLNVKSISANDWMNYSVNIPVAGTYTVNFRVSSVNNGSELQLRNSSGTSLVTQSFTKTNGTQIWKTVSASVTLPAGTQTLRIYATKANSSWNLNWWEIKTPSSAAAVNRVALQEQQPESVTDIPLQVFPNPVQGDIQVIINNNLKGNVRVQVLDISGQIVKEMMLNKIDHHFLKARIEASNLKPGLYILRADMNGWSQSTRITKQ